MSGKKSSFTKKAAADDKRKTSGVGTFFEIQFPDSGKMSFTIVNPGEGNPSEGSISCNTILAQVVLDANAGEEVSFEVRDKKKKAILLKKVEKTG